MFRPPSRRARRGADRYDLPPPTEPHRSLAETIRAASETEPPADAFVQLLNEGYFPPGYVWPVRFLKEELTFWGDNTQRCFELLQTNAMDSTDTSMQVLTRLARLESHPVVDGELLHEHTMYSMGLLGALIDMCHKELLANPPLRESLNASPAAGHDSFALGEDAAPELSLLVDLAHGWLGGIDMRIGAEFLPASGEIVAERWEPSSPSQVYRATIKMMLVRGLARVIATTQP